MATIGVPVAEHSASEVEPRLASLWPLWPLVRPATSHSSAPQVRDWLKCSQWWLADLAHVFCTPNFVCIGRSVLLGTPQKVRNVTVAASHFVRRWDRETIGTWLHDCATNQKQNATAPKWLDMHLYPCGANAYAGSQSDNNHNSACSS